MIKIRSRAAALVAATAVAAAGVLAAGTAYAATGAAVTPWAKITIATVAHSVNSGTFTWTASDPGTSIRVLVYDASTLAKAGDVTVSGTAKGAVVDSLYAGTAYDVKVDVLAGGGHSNSGWSAPRLFFTQAPGGAPAAVGVSDFTGVQGPCNDGGAQFIGWEGTSGYACNGAAGAKGDTGAPGPKGDTGAQGPSGVVATGTKDLGAVASVATGGGFVANATLVGTVDLPAAGTYLVTLNAKATPAAATGAVEIFPQFFVYDQPKNASFAGDLFNVGAGALESGVNANIDSYYSGTSQVTATGAETLDVYAFGYDSDRGAGTYVLDDLSVTATQLQTS